MNKFASQKDLLLVSQMNQYMFALMARLIAQTSSAEAVVTFLENEKKTGDAVMLHPLLDRMIAAARKTG